MLLPLKIFTTANIFLRRVYNEKSGIRSRQQAIGSKLWPIAYRLSPKVISPYISPCNYSIRFSARFYCKIRSHDHRFLFFRQDNRIFWIFIIYHMLITSKLEIIIKYFILNFIFIQFIPLILFSFESRLSRDQIFQIFRSYGIISTEPFCVPAEILRL